MAVNVLLFASVEEVTPGTDTEWTIPQYVLARMRAGDSVFIVSAYIGENSDTVAFPANPTQPPTIEVSQNGVSLCGEFIVNSRPDGSPLQLNPVRILDIPLTVTPAFTPGTAFFLCLVFAIHARG